MRIGVFSDVHDHVDNLRHAVDRFNHLGCELVVFAGDFVSTMVVPHLRALACPLIASFGDNEGNRVGLRGGLRIVGEVADPPFGFRTRDGVRVLVTHQLELLKRDYDGADLVIYGHTHKPSIRQDDAGRWFVNPGETSGWTYRRPTVALVETDPLLARLIELPPLADVPPRQINRSGRSR